MNEDHLIITGKKTENERGDVKWWNMFVQTEEKYLEKFMKLL